MYYKVSEIMARVEDMKSAMTYFSTFTRTSSYHPMVVGSIDFDPNGNCYVSRKADYSIGYNIFEGWYEVDIEIPFEESQHWIGFKTFMEAKAFIYADILNR